MGHTVGPKSYGVYVDMDVYVCVILDLHGAFVIAAQHLNTEMPERRLDRQKKQQERHSSFLVALYSVHAYWIRKKENSRVNATV